MRFKTEAMYVIDVKELSKYIPSFTVLAILLGLINTYTYYIFLDIDILPYLQPSEIIFSFASILFEMAALLISIPIGYIMLLLVNLKEEPNENQAFSTGYIGLIMLAISLAGCVGYGIYGFNKAVEGSRAMLGGMLYLSIVLTPVMLILLYYVAPSKKFAGKTFGVIVSLLIVLSTSYIGIHNLAKSRSFYIVEPRFKYVLSLDNGTEVSTNIDFRYVGNTQNFFFFKNIKLDALTIIPTSEIKEVRRFTIESKEKKN